MECVCSQLISTTAPDLPGPRPAMESLTWKRPLCALFSPLGKSPEVSKLGLTEVTTRRARVGFGSLLHISSVVLNVILQPRAIPVQNKG